MKSRVNYRGSPNPEKKTHKIVERRSKISFIPRSLAPGNPPGKKRTLFGKETWTKAKGENERGNLVKEQSWKIGDLSEKARTYLQMKDEPPAIRVKPAKRLNPKRRRAQLRKRLGQRSEANSIGVRTDRMTPRTQYRSLLSFEMVTYTLTNVLTYAVSFGADFAQFLTRSYNLARLNIRNIFGSSADSEAVFVLRLRDFLGPILERVNSLTREQATSRIVNYITKMDSDPYFCVSVYVSAVLRNRHIELVSSTDFATACRRFVLGSGLRLRKNRSSENEFRYGFAAFHLENECMRFFDSLEHRATKYAVDFGGQRYVDFVNVRMLKHLMIADVRQMFTDAVGVLLSLPFVRLVPAVANASAVVASRTVALAQLEGGSASTSTITSDEVSTFDQFVEGLESAVDPDEYVDLLARGIEAFLTRVVRTVSTADDITEQIRELDDEMGGPSQSTNSGQPT